MTQFGRAMRELGVELILANSPQAKGRVERMNGTLQDRLVKEMRLAGVSDIASANAFLDGSFLAEFNEKFAVAAADDAGRCTGLWRRAEAGRGAVRARGARRWAGTGACSGAAGCCRSTRARGIGLGGPFGDGA